MRLAVARRIALPALLGLVLVAMGVTTVWVPIERWQRRGFARPGSELDTPENRARGYVALPEHFPTREAWEAAMASPDRHVLGEWELWPEWPRRWGPIWSRRRTLLTARTNFPSRAGEANTEERVRWPIVWIEHGVILLVGGGALAAAWRVKRRAARSA